MPCRHGMLQAERSMAPDPAHPQAIQRHVDWSVVKCLVIAGPGFFKDQVMDYIMAGALRGSGLG